MRQRREGNVNHRRMLVNLQRFLVLCLTLALAVSLRAGAAEEKDPTGLQPPAWYNDPELGTRWNRFTGRYIFERTCTSCHFWGPDYWTRSKWKEFLEEFPGNHEPAVAEEYSDLTGMFQPSESVPNATQLTDTLKEFLLSAAPDAAQPQAKRLALFESLPKVGDPAPDFEIVDIEGHHHRVSEYRGKKQLVLVFSRAHW